MLPMRTSTIFKSRWMALVWAAGIIWFAYDFAAPEPQPSGDNILIGNTTAGPVSTDDQKKIADVLGG
jgi:hypothetical protein